MSNKNFNHNDHESFMEGIYGCLERIEIGIIELQKAKTSAANPIETPRLLRCQLAL